MKQHQKLWFYFFLFFTTLSCQKKDVVSPNTEKEFTLEQQSAHSALEPTINNGLSPATDDICLINIQGAWLLHNVLDLQGNTSIPHMTYGPLPDSLLFSFEDLHLDWTPSTGYYRLDFTPTTVQECYHAMYKINCEQRFLDITNLYCSSPTPPSSRCSPPSSFRFKIIRLGANQMILESRSLGWSTTNLFPTPKQYIQRFIFHKL